MKDFKKFATKGNIIDMAVGVIIGSAFGKIVTSLVNDIVMPIITMIVGGKSIVDWKWVIKDAVYDANGAVKVAESAIRYGLFLQTFLDFLIIAFFIFIALRIIVRTKANFAKIEEGIHKVSAKERIDYKKKLKAEGKTRAEVKIAVLQRDAELEAENNRQIEEKKAADEAAKPETTDKILKDIRELLKENSIKKN